MSARHPWRAFGGWIVLVVLGVLAIGALLGGALTTEGNPTNNPESQRAEEAINDSFPAATTAAITDIVSSGPRGTRSTSPSTRRLSAGLREKCTRPV